MAPPELRRVALEELIAGLNPAQREAVTHLRGPLLVFAGAGSGKTRVLTTRVAHLIASREVWPDRLLAVTFTNKAAREMRERVARLVEDADRMWVGTFHATAVRMLRRDAGLLGLPRSFTIFDEDDSRAAVKRVLDELHLDAKKYPPTLVGALISRAKNDLLGPESYPSRGYQDEIVRRCYERYEELLLRSGGLDFDDLIVKVVRLLEAHQDVLDRWRDRFRHVLVDEYQDTNRAQYVLVNLLAGQHRNLAVVGDDDQCLVAGTRVTMADGSVSRIEDIRPGDMVLSGHGSGEFRPARVLRVHRSRAVGPGVAITTAGGRRVVSTPEHTHFAGYRLGVTPQYHFTYLMHRRDLGYRLGTTQVHTRGQVKPVVGFMQRSLQEAADALWIIGTHECESEARLQEYVLSLRYGIPTLPFVPRKGATNGISADVRYLRRVFSSVDTKSAGLRLLGEFGLSASHPHYRPRSRNGNRRNVVLALCGDRRGQAPMHRISIVGNDEKGRVALEGLGLSLRSTGHNGSRSWRHESARKDFGELLRVVERVRSAFEVNLVMTARLGRNEPGSKATNALPFLPAAAVRPGMAMFAADGGHDVVDSVERVRLDEWVYDLDVERTHNFVAEGLVTHNSVYGWRGADVRNILEFKKDYPEATVVNLEQNYRSTQPILDVAYHVIRHNPERAPKRLWTDRVGGERVTAAQLYNEVEEAEYVADEIQRLRRVEGRRHGDFAVLYRINAQSRAFEDVFGRRRIPYRLIGGVRFWERREVKDLLAYLRLVQNPSDTVSFSRIVNVPRRKIGPVSANAVVTAATDSRRSVLEVLEGPLAGVPRAAAGPLERFREQMLSLRATLGALPPSELIDHVIEVVGLDGHYADGTPQGDARLENLKELRGLAQEYDASPDRAEALDQFLTEVTLRSDVDAFAEDD